MAHNNDLLTKYKARYLLRLAGSRNKRRKKKKQFRVVVPRS